MSETAPPLVELILHSSVVCAVVLITARAMGDREYDPYDELSTFRLVQPTYAELVTLYQVAEAEYVEPSLRSIKSAS